MIIIRDNGMDSRLHDSGNIIRFFTTKPAVKGAGHGLSLSYDIIKAHGGKLKVESKEGEFAKFTIELPV